MRKTSLNFSRSEMLRKVALVALMLAIQAITGIGAGVLFAQNVTGQVVSASEQEPLIGASVKVEGLQASSTSLTDRSHSLERQTTGAPSPTMSLTLTSPYTGKWARTMNG